MTQLIRFDELSGQQITVPLVRMNPSAFAFRAFVHDKQTEWSANRVPLSRVKRIFEAAFDTAQRMPRLRVFLAHYVERQLLILDEMHAQRLHRESMG